MENKTSKYFKYAIGEIILVVIGILIALQINNWNEGRKDRVKETSYLMALRTDFENSKIELDIRIKKTNRIKNCALETIQIITLKKEIKNNKTLDSLILGACAHTVFPSTEGVINDILSSGKLDLIQNDSIRRYVSAWKANLVNLRGWESLTTKNFYDYSDLLGNIVDFTQYKDNGLIPEENKVVIYENLKFRNLVDTVRFNNEKLNELYLEKKVEIDSIISIINSELKQKTN